MKSPNRFIDTFNELVKEKYRVLPLEDERRYQLYSEYQEALANQTTYELPARITKSGVPRWIE